MMSPSTANGGSDDKRDDGGNAKYTCDGLPSACPLLLLNGDVLLSVQPLLFLGKLSLDGNSSLSFFSGVSE